MTNQPGRAELRKVFDIPTTNRLIDAGIRGDSDFGQALIRRQTDNLRTVRFFRRNTKRTGAFSDRQKEIAAQLTMQRVASGDIQRMVARMRNRFNTRRAAAGSPGGTDIVSDFLIYDLLKGISEAEAA